MSPLEMQFEPIVDGEPDLLPEAEVEAGVALAEAQDCSVTPDLLLDLSNPLGSTHSVC